MNINISVDAVAWYGAIVATVGVIAASVGVIVSFHAIRRKLRVVVRSTVTSGELIELGVELEVAAIHNGCCIIEVANVGRCPISLQSGPEFRYKSSIQKCQLAWRPRSDLAVGERAVVIIGQNVDMSQLTHVVVKDATGRAWKGKIRK